MSALPAGAVQPPAAAAAAAKAPSKRKRDLDFFAADFDPHKALHTVGLQPPLPVAPLESWEEAARLADVAELTYRELFDAADDPAAQQAVPPSSLLPRVPRASASASAPAPSSLFPTGDGSNLLDMLDDAQAEAAEAKQREDEAQAARRATTTGAQSAASSLPPLSSDSSSRMSAEQILLNRAKADQRALERQQLKEKSKHFMDRFTSLFPVPKPISTPALKARAIEGPMALLRSMHQRRVKVFVVIRRSHGLRCILHAYLSAFDKHWNLLLLDVDETFSEWDWRLCGQSTVQQLLQEGTRFQLPSAKKRRHPRIDEQAMLMANDQGAMEETADSAAAAAISSASSAAPASAPSVVRPPSQIRVETLKQRHVHQLYVRGDSVVSVCEFAPTLFTPERMTASEAAVAAAKMLADRISCP